MFVRRITGKYLYKYKRKVSECFGLARDFLTSNGKLKVLFFGTDNFSLPSITSLHKASLNNSKVSEVSVVTSFKSPSNCIKSYAEANNLKVYKWPIDADSCKQYDLGIVVSFGHLIPSDIIHAFPLGMINVHASILPRWRGAAPIIYSIMKGDTKTGVSIMRIRPNKFDTGEIYAQKEVSIGPHILMPELYETLSKEGANLLISTIDNFPESFKSPQPQNNKNVSYAPKIVPSLAEVHWILMAATDIYNLYRALYGYKALSTKFKNMKVKLLELKIGPKFSESDCIPGSIAVIRNEKCLRVKCKDGYSIDVYKVKVEGKRSMTAEEFTNGFLKKCEKTQLLFH